MELNAVLVELKLLQFHSGERERKRWRPALSVKHTWQPAILERAAPYWLKSLKSCAIL